MIAKKHWMAGKLVNLRVTELPNEKKEAIRKNRKTVRRLASPGSSHVI